MNFASIIVVTSNILMMMLKHFRATKLSALVKTVQMVKLFKILGVHMDSTQLYQLYAILRRHSPLLSPLGGEMGAAVGRHPAVPPKIAHCASVCALLVVPRRAQRAHPSNHTAAVALLVSVGCDPFQVNEHGRDAEAEAKRGGSMGALRIIRGAKAIWLRVSRGKRETFVCRARGTRCELTSGTPAESVIARLSGICHYCGEMRAAPNSDVRCFWPHAPDNLGDPKERASVGFVEGDGTNECRNGLCQEARRKNSYKNGDSKSEDTPNMAASTSPPFTPLPLRSIPIQGVKKAKSELTRRRGTKLKQIFSIVFRKAKLALTLLLPIQNPGGQSRSAAELCILHNKDRVVG